MCQFRSALASSTRYNYKKNSKTILSAAAAAATEDHTRNSSRLCHRECRVKVCAGTQRTTHPFTRGIGGGYACEKHRQGVTFAASAGASASNPMRECCKVEFLLVYLRSRSVTHGAYARQQLSVRERMSKLLCVDQQYKWAWPRLNYNKGKNLLPASERRASE